jgi:hypothetical protein
MHKTHLFGWSLALGITMGGLAVAACGSSTSPAGGGTGAVADAGDEADTPDAVVELPNLLENADFERSQAACAGPWEALPGSTLTTTNVGNVGARACQVCNLGATKAEVAVTVRVAIDPPTDGTAAFALSAFLRDVDGGNQGRLTLVPRDASGNALAASQGQVDVPIDANGWRRFNVASTPKAAAKTLEVRIGGVVNPSGCLAVDGASLTRAE